MAYDIHTLDLHFQGAPGTIASYLIPHEGGGVLVECGPGSTVGALESRLAEHDLSLDAVTDVLVTHVHLDHAGAAGHLAREGATVYVHHVGAPHLKNPEKLLTSAERIYGDDMDRLWGDFLAVPEDQLVELHDGDTIDVGPLHFEVIETPGHAFHHVAYRFEDVCFTGDVAGVRLPGTQHVALPLPPPEIRLDLWNESLDRLRALPIKRLAPTHFGMHEGVPEHLLAVGLGLAEAETWIRTTMREEPSDEALRERVTAWMHERARRDGVSEALWEHYETANPSWMSAAGLKRYWTRHGADQETDA